MEIKRAGHGRPIKRDASPVRIPMVSARVKAELAEAAEATGITVADVVLAVLESQRGSYQELIDSHVKVV